MYKCIHFIYIYIQLGKASMYFCQNSVLKECQQCQIVKQVKVVRFHWKAFEWLYQMKHHMTGTIQILIVLLNR